MKALKHWKKLTVNLPNENYLLYLRLACLLQIVIKLPSSLISSNPTLETRELTKVHKHFENKSNLKDAKKEMLGTFRNLLRLANSPVKYIPFLAVLFGSLSKRESRANLCGIFQEMAKVAPEITDLVRTIMQTYLRV